MRNPVPLIDRLGGVATRRQLIENGCDGFDLTRAVRRGAIRRVRRAHYSTAVASADAVLATRVGGRLAGLSAARSYKLWSGFDRRLHVVVPSNASRLRTREESGVLTPDIADREIIVHWIDEPLTRECWRVSLVTCLRQVVSWTDRETAIACLETAVWKYGIAPRSLAARLGDLGAAAALRAGSVTSGTQEGQESLVTQRLAKLGLVLDRQVTIPGVGRVDGVIRGTRIVIETDGWEFHRTREAFEEDRRRDRALAALGYVSIRLSYEQITTDWANCEAEILAAVHRFQEIV